MEAVFIIIGVKEYQDGEKRTESLAVCSSLDKAKKYIIQCFDSARQLGYDVRDGYIYNGEMELRTRASFKVETVSFIG